MTRRWIRAALCAAGLSATLAPAAQAADGLVVQYPLVQSVGTVATDSSGNGRDATVMGGATWRGPEGLQLDGVDDYVKLPDSLLRNLDAVTVSLNVLVATDQATPYFIYGLGNTTNNAGNGYLFTTGNAYRTSIATGNWSTEQTVTKNQNLTRGIWKTLTYTLGANTAVLYEDGVEVARNANVTITPKLIGGGTTTANYIGRSNYTSDRYLKGQVRDFRVYDRALTAAEVAAFAAISDADRVTKDAASLTLPATATTNLTLPIAGPYQTAIAWSSSDPATISNTGVVTLQQAPKTVTLTATITKGAASEQRAFTVNVPADKTDAEKASEIAAALVVYDANDVRGNLTLDSRATWVSSDPATITPTGEVTRAATAKALTLTATVKVNEATATRVFDVTVRAKAATPKYEGYAFAYFTGEGTSNGEQIYFAGSRGNDPTKWDEVNGGAPVLTSTLGDKGVRDPYIIRSPEGDKFFLIATDLKIYGNGNWDAAQRTGSKYIEVWESTDLKNWSQQRHVKVSPDTAGNTWAPEAYYDDALGAYVVYWASKLYADNDPGHTGNTYNKMVYTTTRDFRTFTPPKVWKDPGYSVIDSTVIKHDGVYYRFTKDERNNTSSTPCSKFILEEKATSLLDLEWDFVKDCLGKADANGPGVSQGEGPTIFKSNTEDKWYLLIDEFGGRGYVPFETTDLASGKFTLSSGWQLPSRPRHGTVLPVTAQELRALRNEPEPVQATPEGKVVSYEGSATDTTGHGYNGTLSGDVTAADGVLTFGGTNGHVKLPDNIMTGLDAMSVTTEVWLDPAQTTPYFIWGLGNTGSDGVGNGYVFTTGDAYRAAIATGNWTTEQGLTSGKNLSRGGWHQLTYTVGGGKSVIYLDGAEVARNDNVTIKPGDIGAGRTTANTIGRSNYTADKYLKGRVKNFTLWNRALSATDVRALNPGVITSVELDALKVPAQIDAGANTILLPVKKGTDLKNLSPRFVLADGTVIEGARDLSQPIQLTAGPRTWTVRAVVMGTPSLPGYNADPNVVRFGDAYYIYATTDGFDGWSGTKFKVWSSRNLVDWTEHPTILDLGPDVSWAESRAWAPAAIEKDGMYYLYYSAEAQIGVAVANSPLGPFVDSGKPLIATNPGGGQAIDPAVFRDDDGQYYLYWGNGAANVVPLNADMVSFDAAKVKRLTGLTNFREGLFMHKRGGVYYLSWSIDDTRSENYRVGYATATSALGDGLVNRGEILTKDASLGILGTGHHSVIQVPGRDEWYIVYHRFGIPGGDGTHREVTIDKLEYNEDGTIKKVVPTLEGIAPVVTRTETPGGVGGTVPATLSLTLGAAAEFAPFVPGVEREYVASTTANVISTAGDAALTVSEPGRLVNGAFSLPQPLQVEFSKASWIAPVSNDPVTITFKQRIGANDALRTGRYAKSLTFTLSTTTP